MKRIAEIHKVYEGGMIQYKIKLCSNFSFDFSGSDVTYVSSIKDVREATTHIVFCDGKWLKVKRRTSKIEDFLRLYVNQ